MREKKVPKKEQKYLKSTNKKTKNKNKENVQFFLKITEKMYLREKNTGTKDKKKKKKNPANNSALILLLILSQQLILPNGWKDWDIPITIIKSPPTEVPVRKGNTVTTGWKIQQIIQWENFYSINQNKMIIQQLQSMSKDKKWNFGEQMKIQKWNKLRKAENGNGTKAWSIHHWNMGSKQFQNKIDIIQELVDREQPDLLYIS